MSIDLTERSYRLPQHQMGGATAQGVDKLVMRTELEDSVVAVEWSQKDAWVFAAAGHNGSLMIGTIPSKEKYRILL